MIPLKSLIQYLWKSQVKYYTKVTTVLQYSTKQVVRTEHNFYSD